MADELDLAVARRTCDAAAAAGTQIAFNISSQSAQNAGFRERLLRLLAENATSRPSLVSIEMTETAEIEDLAEATRTAEALRAVGVPFCIDDFGAGTADVRLLRALGADIVKLDGSYVRGVAQAGRERAFVAGIVEIARAAGAEILAEHVETEDEARALLSMGVRYGQGWLFGRPGPLPGREPGARQNAARPSGVPGAVARSGKAGVEPHTPKRVSVPFPPSMIERHGRAAADRRQQWMQGSGRAGDQRGLDACNGQLCPGGRA